jgi:prepilin-type N-terminal cleavage/methylation domain-containing protein
MRNHRGFTLVELLVVLLIMTIVTGGIYKLLNSTQRLSRAQTERIDLQSNVRTASVVIPSELRELNTVIGGTISQVDILAKSDSSITYRAMRGFGFVCTGTTINQLRLSNWAGYRAPVAGKDSVYVFNDGTASNSIDIGSDDTWDPRQVTAVPTGNTCAAGIPATTLTLGSNLTAIPPNGTPVRTYEVMELSLYQNGGKAWLGMRSVSAGELVLQPLLGPLRDGALIQDNGLRFQYLDANGAATAVNANIKSIVVTIRGETSQKVSSGGGNAYNTYVQDSLVSLVSLRNALR